MIHTELFQNTMQELEQRISAEMTILEKGNLPLTGIAGYEDPGAFLEKTKDTHFRLLVMGRFSSGKSSCINALLGERILAEGAVPMTALITEIYYAEEKKVVMYPREGRWPGGNEPFEIEPKLSEIRKYSTLNAKNGFNSREANRIDTAFEKMVIFWPLEILKGGVSIVDSPGTNDPYANDYIVEEYVPKADAILYCIPAHRAYDGADRNALERINARGFENPIIVTTNYDIVAEDMDDEEAEAFREETFKSYSRHTRREHCFYVDSRQALQAKTDACESDYVQSGYEALEHFLGEFLTEHKGREKVGMLTAALKSYNRIQIGRIDGITENMDLSAGEFDARVEKAEEKLEHAVREGERVVRELRDRAGYAGAEISKLLPQLYDRVYTEVDLDGFEPDTEFTIRNSQESSRQIAQECSSELRHRFEKAAAEWNKTVFQPRISELLTDISRGMEKQSREFSDLIRQARVSLEPASVDEDIETSGSGRVAMILYALFESGGLSQFMGALVNRFTGVNWNTFAASEKIKKKIVNQNREFMQQNKDSIIADLQKQCTDIFSETEKKLKQAVEEEIHEIRSSITLIRRERSQNAAAAADRRGVLDAVRGYLKETDQRMDEIRDVFSIESRNR